MTDIQTRTFLPGEPLPQNLITPQQTHSNRVVQIITGQEDLINCDGLWTNNPQFLLGVQTADCAPICMWNKEQYGIVHAGWRGVVNGAVENMLAVFKDEPQIWIGPLLPVFEIQPDDCYTQIEAKFGTQFFTNKEDKIYFEFKKCLQRLLPQAEFNKRITAETSKLASWRRDKSFPNGQNVTTIWR